MALNIEDYLKSIEDSSYNFTSGQKGIVFEAARDAVKRIIYLKNLKKRIGEEIVSLPFVREDGLNVRHGANMEMRKLYSATARQIWELEGIIPLELLGIESGDNV